MFVSIFTPQVEFLVVTFPFHGEIRGAHQRKPRHWYCITTSTAKMPTTKCSVHHLTDFSLSDLEFNNPRAILFGLKRYLTNSKLGDKYKVLYNIKYFMEGLIMENIKSSDLDRLMEDITAIKTVINRNKDIIQKILMPQHFRIFCICAGIVALFFSFSYQYLFNQYGNYQNIPYPAKTVMYVLIVIAWMFLVFIKYRGWGASLSSIDKELTLGRALKAFFSYRIIHIYLPTGGVMAVLCAYLATVNAYYIIPMLSIGIGLQFNFVGIVSESRQWVIAGYWFLATGVLTLLFTGLSAMMAMALTFGCGFLLFGLIPMRKE
jgi:hypothetical protein